LGTLGHHFLNANSTNRDRRSRPIESPAEAGAHLQNEPGR
jgi:hypothetical protein